LKSHSYPLSKPLYPYRAYAHTMYGVPNWLIGFNRSAMRKPRRCSAQHRKASGWAGTRTFDLLSDWQLSCPHVERSGKCRGAVCEHDAYSWSRLH